MAWGAAAVLGSVLGSVHARTTDLASHMRRDVRSRSVSGAAPTDAEPSHVELIGHDYSLVYQPR